MPPAPLVSIVMPSFNHAKFISASIDSVLGQDYNNVELIVGDGGSDDGTVEILRKRSEEDPRLRWFSRPDSGPAEAINNALAMVRGTVVGWLNSDDLYTSGAIGRAVQALNENQDWLMVYGKGQHVDISAKVINNYPTLPPSTPVSRFSDGCFICQPTVFFKSTMPMLLGNLDQTLKASFDFDYWLRAFLAFPERIGMIDAMQASSRLHDDCITMRMRQTVALEGVRVVSRHLEQAPIHWLTTYIEETLATPPEERTQTELRRDLLETIKQAEGKIKQVDFNTLIVQIETNPVFAQKEDSKSLEQIYIEVALQPVLNFYGIIRSSVDKRREERSEEDNLIGLLTFPNSGTSWFLQLCQVATGIRNHTAYEHEAIKTNGGPSRGVYILNSRHERDPEEHDPSLVKSHVAEYGEEDVTRINFNDFDNLVSAWMELLPPNCGRHIRLVRNPFDNLRARYHLYLKLYSGHPEKSLLDFRQFYQQDLRRYLLWHAYCDRVADEYPVMSLQYSDLLDKEKAHGTILNALRFAGYDIELGDVERAYKTFSPIYSQNKHIPVHLEYYSESDIHWMERELEKWLKLYSKLSSSKQAPLTILKRALRRK